MIILLATKQPSSLVQLIEQEGHCVVFQTDHPSQIILPLFEWSPHVVFIHAPNSEARQLLAELAEKFPATRFVAVDAASDCRRIVLDALHQPPLAPSGNTAIPDQRQLLLDPRYHEIIESEKLASKRNYADHPDEKEVEALRLLWLLRAARQNRHRAKAYHDTLSQLEGCEFQEIGFRIASGDWHGPVYARTQIGKYLAFLAHSVPGLDIDSLPIPGNTIPDVRFVEYGASLRLIYALHGLSLVGFNTEIYTALIKSLDWSHSRQDKEEITRSGLHLSGLLFNLRGVANAHSTTLEWMLHPQAHEILDIDFPRSLLRAKQLFAQFWGMTRVMEDTLHLRNLLFRFSTETTQPDLPDGLKPPSFAEFYKVVCSCEQQGSPKSK